MSTVKPGRWTHRHDDDVVVFTLGMTVNRWRSVDAWLSTFRAMPRMLAELSEERDRGLLGYSLAIGRYGPVVTTYWRSVEQLLAYAHDVEGEHRPAWGAFNRAARKTPGAVGIWHETFIAAAGHHESIYADVPMIGLAAATASVPVERRRDSARQRITTSSSE